MMTTASAPPVVVTAPAAAHMAVAMPVAALGLDEGAVHRARGRHAQPGGSGYGHCQQRKTNQGDTSHTVSSRSRDCDVMHKFPMERFVPARMK
jgi:hypothetical protein